jgi:hypothetical protein
VSVLCSKAAAKNRFGATKKLCRVQTYTGFVVTKAFIGSSSWLVGTPTHEAFAYWLYLEVAAKVRCS